MAVVVALVFSVAFCSVRADVDGSVWSSRLLNVSDLDYYVTTDEGRDILKEEFLSIKGGKRKPWTVAELPENLKKNRYEDLLAFDDTRVVLEKTAGDEFSDYINANYINGYKKSQEYVATQGPLPNTINDFWRMIWQLKTKSIVMLANVIEHGEVKVEKYWPEFTTKVYGNIAVTKLTELKLPSLEHVVRVFHLYKPGEFPRVLRQYHFTGWPDLGVPNSSLPVVVMMKQARQYNNIGDAPIVTHCSAGVGRTGTTILIDSMLQKAQAERIVDFPTRLNEMRLQRPDLVEKSEQYLFAHAAVKDFWNADLVPESLKDAQENYILANQYLDEFDIPSDPKRLLSKIMHHNQMMKLLFQVLEKSTSQEKP